MSSLRRQRLTQQTEHLRWRNDDELIELIFHSIRFDTLPDLFREQLQLMPLRAAFAVQAMVTLRAFRFRGATLTTAGSIRFEIAILQTTRRIFNGPRSAKPFSGAKRRKKRPCVHPQRLSGYSLEVPLYDEPQM